MYDTTYLMGAFLESFRKSFNMLTDVHIMLFPYFLYPLHSIAMTGYEINFRTRSPNIIIALTKY